MCPPMFIIALQDLNSVESCGILGQKVGYMRFLGRKRKVTFLVKKTELGAKADTPEPSELRNNFSFKILTKDSESV